ncbi:MAG TPA: M56 family metallopeptidase [Pseudonocardiaceae bacterium]|jgi:beta-lactamase regulating signal transducer with metallopeptidase domain|nr:M56 family metallopeptidase [Pseudonocardiaceae bacterium]
MTGAVCGAIVAIVAFAVAAPRVGRYLSPALATRLLVAASVATAASTVFVLGALAATWVGQLPAIAAFGPWSTARLDAADPVPDPIAALSLVLLTVATIWAVIWSARRVRALLAVYRDYRDLSPTGSVVVLDSATVDAFATPAPAGRIVVTAALWDALSPDERGVVLAHEQSHLAHRHTWWTLAAELASTINPLLRPTTASIRHAVERWADEDAAVRVADRKLVARTIARTALLQHDRSRSGPHLSQAATGGDVPQRVRALLVPPPRRSPFALVALCAVVAITAATTLGVERTSDHLFDQADTRTTHQHHHHPL